MEANADVRKAALVHADRLPWVASPAPGVDRRILSRSGGERAVATSIVRYSAGSAFPSHAHPLGEEFLVLDGVFADERGTYPAGTYVRNPPGSSHAPASPDGCTLFVKLMQFQPDDSKHVVANNPTSPIWPPPHEGTASYILHSNGTERVEIVPLQAGMPVDISDHGGLELLVLHGSISLGGEQLNASDWLRLPPSMAFDALAGPAGCAVWLKTGHLVRAMPARSPIDTPEGNCSRTGDLAP